MLFNPQHVIERKEGDEEILEEKNKKKEQILGDCICLLRYTNQHLQRETKQHIDQVLDFHISSN